MYCDTLSPWDGAVFAGAGAVSTKTATLGGGPEYGCCRLQRPVVLGAGAGIRGGSALCQRSLYPLRPKWRLPQADTGGIEYGVADDRCRGVRRWFAGAVGRIFRAVVDQHDVDVVGHLVETQNRVIGPVAAGDVGFVERHFLVQ